MTNDNQTAMMMSIQRKKDRIKDVRKNWAYYSPRVEELELQIAEDEKLLPVEKEQFEQFGIDNQKEAFDYRDGNTECCKTPQELYREKYGKR